MYSDPFGITFAFTAGMFALFSPCGFPMLPGYISYYVGVKAPLERAVKSGFACISGLLVVFSIIGVAASMLGGIISKYVSSLELIAGLITMMMGLITFFNIKFPTFLPPLGAPRRRSFVGIFVYGCLYGLVTLGCSAPIFFSVLFYAIAAGGTFFGVIIFAVYALGMGVPLFIITLFVSKAKSFIFKRMIKATPILEKLSGIILITIGLYLVLYYFIVFYAT